MYIRRQYPAPNLIRQVPPARQSAQYFCLSRPVYTGEDKHHTSRPHQTLARQFFSPSRPQTDRNTHRGNRPTKRETRDNQHPAPSRPCRTGRICRGRPARAVLARACRRSGRYVPVHTLKRPDAVPYAPATFVTDTSTRHGLRCRYERRADAVLGPCACAAGARDPLELKRVDPLTRQRRYIPAHLQVWTCPYRACAAGPRVG